MEELRRRFPRRVSQIDFLYAMYGREDEPLMGAVYVLGVTGTGKSSLVRAALFAFGPPHAYVDLVRHWSTRGLLLSLLEQLTPPGEPPPPRCEHFADFLHLLAGAMAGGRRAVLVLDRAERLRDMDSNLLPALLRLREISALDISVILISTLELSKLTHRLHVATPLVLRFQQYSREDILEITLGCSLARADVEPFGEEFQRGYLSVLLAVFYRCCRDLPELRHQARRHYAAYCSPVYEGVTGERDSLRLYQRFAPVLRTALDTVHVRAAMSGEGDWRATTEMPLPFYAKYLLIAAYLASYNPAREDKRLFVKERAHKRKTLADTRRRARISELLNTQLGPKPFTLDRMLAIFFSVVSERAGLCSNLMSQISSLVRMQLLTAVGHADHTLDGQRFKCNVDFEYIHSISKSVGFNIRKYLFDFM